MATLKFKKTKSSNDEKMVWNSTGSFGKIQIQLYPYDPTRDDQLYIRYNDGDNNIMRYSGAPESLDGWTDNDGGDLMDGFWEELEDFTAVTLRFMAKILARNGSRNVLNNVKVQIER